MSLPVTYYDVIVKRDPELVAFVKKDIKNLKGLQGPFATDDFSVFIDDYISDVVDKFSKEMLKNLEVLGIKNFDEQMLFESPQFRKLLLSRHIEYITLANFELFGKKAFYINDNLTDHLSQTNLEIDSDFLQLPFDSCLFVYTSKTAIRALHAILEDSGSGIDFRTPISVFASSLPAEEGKRKILFACWQANHDNNYAFVKRELLIRDGWSITQTLKTDWNEIHSEVESEDIVLDENYWGIKEGEKIFHEQGLVFFRILINTILYMVSNDADVKKQLSPYNEIMKKYNKLKSEHKKKKLKGKLDQISRLDYSEVGANTSPIVIGEKGHKNSVAHDDSAAQRMDRRVVVRGHWRNQPYGANLSKRKLVWIKPYYKGPEMG